MPRLRVLSMRNNHLRTIKERTFRNLRGNIAILDVDGKCNSPASSPVHLLHFPLGNPIDCNCEMQWLSVWLQETNFPYPGPKCQDGRLLRAARMERSLCVGLELFNEADDNKKNLPRDANHLPLLNEHGDVFQRDLPEDFNDECEAAIGDRPMVGDSEYFYDQYVDSTDVPDASNALVSSSQRPRPATASSSTFSSTNGNVDLNNTLLHTKYFNRRPQPPPGAGSPFTFFGYPIPSLSLGRFFGFGERGRKERKDQEDSVMPATHRMAHIQLPSGRGKTRMYQPNSAEFEKYLREQQKQQQQQQNARNRIVDTDGSSSSNSGEEAMSNENGAASTVGIFRTTFREPASIERGGFRPIVPAHVGGFMPVHDPQQRRGLVEPVNVTISNTSKPHMERHFVPIALPPAKTTTSGAESSETATYYVTEETPDVTTQTPPMQRSTRPMTSTQRTTTTTTTTTSPSTSTSTTSRTTTAGTTTAGTTSSEQQPVDSQYDDEEDLEAQSVTLLRPPQLLQTTTAETILLIPPPEEHEAQIKSHSWLRSTTTETVPQSAAAAPIRGTLRTPGGRSTITKVYTPHQQQQQQLSQPTAEEYQRTTPSGQPLVDNERFLSEQQVIPARQAQKRTDTVDTAERKDGMDWYYESFKKKREFTERGAAVRTAGVNKDVLPHSHSSSSASWRRQPNKREVFPLLILLLLFRC